MKRIHHPENQMKKGITASVFAVVCLWISVSLSACTGSTDTQTDTIPDTSAYVPVGSVWFEWDSYKIYSSYEDPNEPESEPAEDEEGTTDGTNTVSDTQEDNKRLGLFDCSEEKPHFIADVPSLEQFAVSQKYGQFYTWETAAAQNQESTDANGYSVRKYDYTLSCYSLARSHIVIDRPDYTPLRWSKTIYGIDKITDRLWWDDTTLFVRTEREYLGDNRPENPAYQHAYAISLSGQGSCAAFEEISEADIPYAIPEIDFDAVDQKIRSSCTAQDGVVGAMGFADCEITANGQLRKLNIPLYIYKGRKDYNDYWYLSEAEIRITPYGPIVLSGDYVDEDAPFYESSSYEKYAVHKTDPLENWGLDDLSQTLNSTKQFCENAQDIIAYAQKHPLFYNLFFNRYPADNNSSGNYGMGRIEKYTKSIENRTMQSLRLSANGVQKIKAFRADSGMYQFFILLPQYPKGTIDAKDIYATDTPSIQQTDCAYPIQIEISTEK